MIRIDPRSQGAIADIRRKMLLMVPELSREVRGEAVQVAFDAAFEAADRHTKTGALIRSLKMRKSERGGYLVYHDRQTAPHALFVHWGTRAHVIKPRTKKALRWVGTNGFVFAKIVHHPGYRGDPYLIGAREAIARRFASIAQNAWNDLTRRLFNA